MFYWNNAPFKSISLSGIIGVHYGKLSIRAHTAPASNGQQRREAVSSEEEAEDSTDGQQPDDMSLERRAGWVGKQLRNGINMKSYFTSPKMERKDQRILQRVRDRVYSSPAQRMSVNSYASVRAISSVFLSHYILVWHLVCVTVSCVHQKFSINKSKCILNCML